MTEFKTKKIDISAIMNSTALKESGILYVIVVAITISNLIENTSIGQIIALCLSFLGVLFGGYIKKAAELRMAELAKKNVEKDEQIIKLKERIADLNSIEKKLTETIKEQVENLINKNH